MIHPPYYWFIIAFTVTALTFLSVYSKIKGHDHLTSSKFFLIVSSITGICLIIANQYFVSQSILLIYIPLHGIIRSLNAILICYFGLKTLQKAVR